jgi:hypothetical protein
MVAARTSENCALECIVDESTKEKDAWIGGPSRPPEARKLARPCCEAAPVASYREIAAPKAR